PRNLRDQKWHELAMSQLASPRLTFLDEPLEQGVAAPVELVRREKNRSYLRITLKEGRKRQVRRMCEAVGHPVLSLKRIAIGPLCLGRLKPGEYRHLSASEVARLKRHVGLQ
ncbi:MAG: pseudouridine synthase, partial [Firmicutes bacterium]|nr:pseudouridine synthase [Bacillota bacterium]